MKARVIAAVISVEMMTLAGCRDFGPDPAGPDRQPPSSGVSTNQQSAPQPGDRDRKDTRWQHMDDQQFAADVSRAAGRVTIGLKDPAAADGVDNRGQVLVSPTAVREAKEALRAMGITPLYEFRRIPAIVADVSPELAVVLRRNPVVDYIQPSLPGEYFAQVTPWNVTKVKAPPAWSYSTGSGVKLLILDSGVDSLARDLSIPVAWRCVNASLSVWDRLGHGTFVAGVAGALNNSLDVVGVAYGVSLWSANNEVNLAPNAAESACAVDAARVNGVSVVNMSFGLSPYTALTDAINGGYNQDNMIFVAAVGNGGGGPVDYPASLSNVIGATATDSTNAHASFANVGSQVELSAPGVDVLSTSLPNGSVCSNGGFTATCSGTSFAAPHVSAAAAILRALHPTWSNATIRNRLRSTATDLGSAGFDNTFGYGLLNLQQAAGPTVTLNGSTLAWSGYSQTWSATASGGLTPYSYQWYVDGTASGTGSSFNYTPGGSDFWLKVQLTDNIATVAKDSIFVTVSSCAPPQISC